MQFTYDAYRGLIQLLKNHGYLFATYADWNYCKCAIIRHDIDNDIEKALKLARIEKSEGVSSTYFVLLSSDFYNVFSLKNAQMLKNIASLGHDIGLHFDQMKYTGAKINELVELIAVEAQLLSSAIELPVKCVSMHRPSKDVLDADLVIPGLINSYGHEFFREFKYLSDSRRRWREPVEEIIKSEKYNRLHILTHAFWYNEKDIDIHMNVKSFVNHANIERFLSMKENIADMDSIMKVEEVVYEKN